MMEERHNSSKCVCWIEIEVWRKTTWDLTKKAKISSALLKMEPFANQLAGVIDLEDRAGNAMLKRDILRANATDPMPSPAEELVRSTFRSLSTPQILQRVEATEHLTKEQAKVCAAFRAIATDARGGDNLPITVVQGRNLKKAY